jgi:hypothetical protein
LGLTLEYDAENKILLATIEGPLTAAVLVELQEAAGKWARSSNAELEVGIVDISRVTKVEISSDEIRDVARRPMPLPSKVLRIGVAPKDLLYGLVRMFQLLTESTRPNFQNVRTLEEAYRLINVEAPQFERVA